MSTTNTQLVKRSFKYIEMPLNKFKNEEIPFHQALFLKHKSNAQKMSIAGDFVHLDREVRDKQRVVVQLNQLTYELDTLRTQVNDCDLDKFDTQTLPLRKIILELVTNYKRLEMQAHQVIEEHTEIDENVVIPQIQIQGDIAALRLQQAESQLVECETINRDIQDIHHIFCDIHKMVDEQHDQVENITANTEVTQENVKGGLLQLIKASKLHKASYPATGALIGTLIGGPIGSVAGLKIGGIAALGCGLIGYLSGRFFKKANNAEVLETEVELQAEKSIDNDGDLAVNTTSNKKNI